MAARRGKNQAKRSGKAGLPGGAIVLIVMLVGAAAFGWWQYRDRFKAPDSNLPKPDPQAMARGGNGEEVAPLPDKPKPKYDFYTLLPEKEVVIPDAELNAQAQAEAAARMKAAAQAAAQAQAGNTSPADLNTPSLSLDAPAPALATPAKGERYLIQAGAFRGSAEAEALKAKIALTGEIARVEVAQINGNTVHRVRMGPYPDASALASAKQALASHGIDAQAIKVK
jgi:cell division protein FtsN